AKPEQVPVQPPAPTPPVPGEREPGTYPPDRRRKDPSPFKQEGLPERGLRERIAQTLKEMGVPAWAVAAVTVAIVAALADPEPFSKIAAIVGVAAATAILIAIGRLGDAPSGPSA
ncbi:hypothetical protein, partial [Nocardia tenerifensis]|uniref:hypothetical protein n=1 Tax=Nocardia tenerifensis TaxID=228006 RepID=UPI001C3F2BAB